MRLWFNELERYLASTWRSFLKGLTISIKHPATAITIPIASTTNPQPIWYELPLYPLLRISVRLTLTYLSPPPATLPLTSVNWTANTETTVRTVADYCSNDRKEFFSGYYKYDTNNDTCDE